MVSQEKINNQSFRIIDLAKKTFQIFGFKGVIRKIFRNKDLQDPSLLHPIAPKAGALGTPVRSGFRQRDPAPPLRLAHAR